MVAILGANSADDAFEVSNSLRFNPSDSTHLSLAQTAGNRRTLTFSTWLKRCNLGDKNIFNGGNSTSEFTAIYFTSADELFLYDYRGAEGINVKTNRKFRDLSAWYHIVVAFDTTQSTASDRVKFYVNGVQETSFSSTNYPAQNLDLMLNVNSSFTTRIGRYPTSSSLYFDGYMCETAVIEGSQLAPTDFGEFNSDGFWIPKDLSTLTFGNEGFYLKYENTSDAGEDSSGNGNNFTGSGMGALDHVPDTCTNNFSTFNANLAMNSTMTLVDGGLQGLTGSNYASGASNTWFSSMGMSSGKWYAEFKLSSATADQAQIVGVGYDISKHQQGSNKNMYNIYYENEGWGYIGAEGKVKNNNSDVLTGLTTWYTNAIVSVALDLDNYKLWFRINDGSWENSGDPAGNSNGISLTSGKEYFFGVSDASLGNTYTYQANFGCPIHSISSGNSDANGHGNFEYSVPSGFLALCTANLATTDAPAFDDPSAHFHIETWTGTSDDSTKTVTNNANAGDFKPDWLWIKARSGTYGSGRDHALFDTSRGVTKRIETSSSDAEASTDSNNTFNTDGFTLTANYSINGPSTTYVGWQWKAGGPTPTKTYKVVVVSDSGNKYRFRNSSDTATFAQSAVTLDLQEGGTYVFDWSDSSAQGHPIRFSTTSDGTHGGGSEYTTGVVKDDSSYKTTITIAASAPQLYYYCSNHSGMGGTAKTNASHGQTNFDGSLLSVPQVNTDAGFSIISYEGNFDTMTIGHGLSQAPEALIIKNRDASGSWVIYHKGLNFPTDDLIYFNTNAANQHNPTFNNTAPTSSVITMAAYSLNNQNNNFHVCYAFHSVKGYSHFGSYTGNGNADGPMAYCGFRPKWVMIKCTTTTSTAWNIFDTTREDDGTKSGNVMTEFLQANSTSAETTSGSNISDFLSNGFKLRGTSSATNGNGQSYIYFAFAEFPFVSSKGVPTTAR